MRRSVTAGIVALAATGLTTAGVVLAHDGDSSSDGAIDHAKITHQHHADDHQHGGTDGHIDVENYGVELVSKLELKNVEPGKIADVGVHEGYAYLAAWGGETCKYNGVHVVDIRDVDDPEEVAFIPSKEGSAPGEGVQALSIETTAFRGDILVTNNEKCDEAAGFGGLNIHDISNPAAPTPLTVGFGDATVPGQGKKAANDIHSVFAWDAGDRAYAVIVDNEEGADVDIVDITNPKKPAFVAEYDLDEEFPQIEQATPANLTQVFLHDMIVKEIDGRFVMLASYWDGGYVTLDVTDPTDVRYLGDSDFAEVDPELLEQTTARGEPLAEAPEGNAHQAEFTLDDEYVLAADEDFTPFGLRGTSSDPLDGGFQPIPGSGTPALEPGETLTGPTTYVGLACAADAGQVPPASVDGEIAVIARGVCTFTEKVATVTAAGYDAALVVNREGADGCGPIAMSVTGSIPAFSVSRSVGYALMNIDGFDEDLCLIGTGTALPVSIGTPGDEVTVESFFDGWGYVHLYRNGEGKLAELDTFAVPEAMDPAYAVGSGDLSVHEVATSHDDPALVYVSYYAAGLRLLEITGDEQLVEVGAYIDEGGNNFWGVEVFESDGVEYVAASDRDFGLYIFRAGD